MIRSNSVRSTRLRVAAVLAACGLVVAACGSDDDATDSAPATTGASGSDTTDDSGSDTSDAPADTSGSATTDGESAGSAECATDAVLTWGYGDQIRDWDPHDSPAGQDQWYLMAVYDRLFGQAPDGETLPDLAESWEFSDDALTLTLNIRQDVLFQDGTPLTTDIVAQNLDRARGAMDAAEGAEGFSTSFKADLASISEVVVVDDSTVEIKLSEPNVALPNILSDRPGMVMAPSTFDGSGNSKPIGTGPFALTSWTEGDGGEAVLVKFDDYWDADNIQIAGLVLKDLRDPTARFNALQAGDIDGARINPVDYDAANKNSDLAVDTGDTVEAFWYNMDTEIVPELSDPRVRQAMSLAIDRQAITDTLLFGLGTPTVTHMPPFYWASSPDVEVTSGDVDAAKALLEEAGVGSFTIPILTSSTQGLVPDMTQAVAGMLSQIGITLDVQVAGENLANRLYFDRDGGGVIGPWSGRADPAQTIANVYGPGFVNMSKVTDPEIDALLDDSNAATDRDDRQQLLWQIDDLESTFHTSGIALVSPKTIFAYKDGVSGLPIYVQGKHEFRDACIAPAG